MSGRIRRSSGRGVPGPPKVVIAKHPQSWSDPELYNALKSLQDAWGIPFSHVVERVCAQALLEREPMTVPQQLPLDESTVAA
ncbi:hypothetical protein ACIBH1_45685 [Nonomuraea sp. NPDC050663]|uniref:hypothetical protein n=1 Tax=Nonomuraea sp. NPDC050663 TaxID=3364370 RepID=UPI003798CA8C